jgi:hypothetical protein
VEAVIENHSCGLRTSFRVFGHNPSIHLANAHSFGHGTYLGIRQVTDLFGPG